MSAEEAGRQKADTAYHRGQRRQHREKHSRGHEGEGQDERTAAPDAARQRAGPR